MVKKINGKELPKGHPLRKVPDVHHNPDKVVRGIRIKKPKNAQITDYD